MNNRNPRNVNRTESRKPKSAKITPSGKQSRSSSKTLFNTVIVILILVIAILVIKAAVNASKNSQSGVGNTYNENAPTICIDPGHGFGDTGASSDLLRGVDEKDLNLSIAEYTSKALSDKGYNVVMTRTDDTMPEGYSTDNLYTMTPQDRAGYANNCQGLDLFVSIHCNSYPQSSEIRGTRIYYYRDHSPNISLFAQNICDGISSMLPDISVKPYPMSLGEAYYVVKNVSVPSLLIETGFITNPTDAALMIDEAWQKKFAEGISEGIALYCQSANLQ